MEKDKIRTLFQSKFNIQNWTQFLISFFGAKDIRKEPQLFLETGTEKGYYIGSQDISNYLIGYFYYKIGKGSVAHKKIGLRKLVSSLINVNTGEYDSAIVVFDDGKEWRLSFICDMRASKTSAKRFTYVFGDSMQYYNTATNRFFVLQDNITFENIAQAFSVEQLSDDFFEEYREHYADFVQYVTGKRIVKVGNNKWEEKKIHEPNKKFYSDFGRDDKRIRDYVKKMMGRLVFLYFVQRKGWLAGNQNYMFDLFKNSKCQDDFLDKVLEPMFFGLLNTPPDKREKKFKNEGWNIDLLPNWKRIPYLNGGLFEKDENDVPDSQFPKELFHNETTLFGGDPKRYNNSKTFDYKKYRGLLDFFASYNFTVDENDPNDAEIGIDPEMLGKIFENLLEDNKDKGAFYTPKEIVSYMCKESLISYLQTKTSVTEENIRTLVSEHDEEFVKTLSRKEVSAIRTALQEVKICDPAIGSGAFPMGMLNELVGCRIALGHADGAKKVACDQPLADLKRDIIQNNIYGVDIEKGAIDIARLRFWLSIVVDSEEPKPLPNFDYKFMEGNSLITTFKGHYIDLEKNVTWNNNNVKLKKLKEELSNLQQDFYSSKDSDKYQEEIAIKNKLIEIIAFQLDFERELAGNKKDGQLDIFAKPIKKSNGAIFNLIDEAKALKSNLNNNKQSVEARAKIDIPFFDWKICFPDVFNSPSNCNGFDIVIGNPPYIQLQKDGGTLGKMYQDCGFETFTSTGDIYSLFYEKGWQILKENGHLCFITSNKWMRAGYGEQTRKFFAEKTNPILLIDFAGVQVFDSATVDTNILLYIKANNQRNTITCKGDELTKNDLKNLSDFVKQHKCVCSFTNSDSWVILSSIEQSIKNKIESVGTPLRDWNINIYRGVLTGYNDAFIIDTIKRDEILANCKTEDERKRTAELIRPILRGRDIKRYGYDWANLWLIATFPSKKYDIEEYPAVKEFLQSFGVERLEQTGKKHNVNGRTVKARKKTNNKWFETQDSISYWDDFNKPKIIYPNMTKYLPFVWDNKQFLTNQKCFIITGTNTAFLTAFFNSSLFKFCFRDSFPELQGGTRELSKIFFDKIPVLIPESAIENQFKELVSDIQKEFTKEKAMLIDSLIFDIYNLTEEERQVIGFVEIK